jgi:gamma-glutamyltranspeptidase/glutathione hydrolase
VWTVPPPSQGYVTLAGAWIADGLPLGADVDDPAFAHLLVEAAKQAGHDRPAVLHEHADGAALCAPARLAGRRAAIDPGRAAPVAVPGRAGGTIHLNAVDAAGLTVSLTQSNCAGFGAHLVVPGLGVFLQNRGIGFSLEPGHPAEYGPGRRPPHTLCPTLVTDASGRPRYALGTMGADSQPMVLLQLLARLLAAGQDAAAAVAAGRWVLTAPDAETFGVWSDPAALRLRVEGQAPEAWAAGLRARGHAVEVVEPFAYFAGHAHVVAIGDDGLTGAADPRALTGAAAGL